MRSSAYLKFILTVLTLSVIYLGIVGINAIDRLHRSNVELLKKLEDMPLAVRSEAVGTPESAETLPGSGTIANSKYFEPSARRGGRINLAINAEPPNLNPLTCNEATAAAFNALCSASLAARNWENPDVFEPMIAESWEISPDKKVFRIKLRRGVKFCNVTDPVTGKEYKDVEVTSADFKFMVDTIKNKEVNCAHLRAYYQDLEKVEIVNDYEFLVYWKKPFYGSVACTLDLSPLARHFYAPDGKFDPEKFNSDHLRSKMIVNCGPYMLDKWEKAKRLVFKRNPGYFGIRYGIAPPLDERVYEVISHPNTCFQALLSGGFLTFIYGRFCGALLC